MNPSIDPASSSQGTPPSRLRRLVRWTFSWKGVRAFLFTGATIVTLLVLALAIYNFYGERKWAGLRSELESKGVRLSLKALVPPAVPDDQNMAMTPLFAPLYAFERYHGGQPLWIDEKGRARLLGEGSPFGIQIPGKETDAKLPPVGQWRLGQTTDLVEWQDYYAQAKSFPHPPKPGTPGADVLIALDRHAAEIAELEKAMARPHLRFGIHYEEENPSMILLPHLALVKKLITYCQLSAIAMLSEGQGEKALGRLLLGLRWMEGLDPEPILISQLVRIACWHILSQVMWEGMGAHAWNAEQLARLKEAILRVEFLERGRQAMEGERTFGNAVLDRWSSRPELLGSEMESDMAPSDPKRIGFLRSVLFPRGFVRLNQVRYNECMTSMVQAWNRSLVAGDGSPGASEDLFEKAMNEHLERGGPHNMIARMLVPALAKVFSKSRLAQSTRDVALVAIALEQHRVASGAYPDSLDALSPRWLDKVPVDVFSAKPLHYRKDASASFVLHSVGLDGENQEGQFPASLAEATGGRSRKSSGSDDVVWSYPRR